MHRGVECLIIRPSRRNERAIAAYRKAGFVPHDPLLHPLPAWVLTEELDYPDAVVLLRTRAAEGKR
jgi:uroporphyrinogen-III synthase